ncbi:hypothetical protein Bbelb_368090 [Branchiostoma belcheri]|nr:hypothetical protein Bbelb_368090 [Branchiostoma belcheri]
MPLPALIAFLNTHDSNLTYGSRLADSLSTAQRQSAPANKPYTSTAENKCRTRGRLNPTGREVVPTGRDERLWHKLHPYSKDGLLPLISPPSLTDTVLGWEKSGRNRFKSDAACRKGGSEKVIPKFSFIKHVVCPASGRDRIGVLAGKREEAATLTVPDDVDGMFCGADDRCSPTFPATTSAGRVGAEYTSVHASVTAYDTLEPAPFFVQTHGNKSV